MKLVFGSLYAWSCLAAAASAQETDGAHYGVDVVSCVPGCQCPVGESGAPVLRQDDPTPSLVEILHALSLLTL